MKPKLVSRQELLELDITTYNLAFELQYKKDRRTMNISTCKYCDRKYLISCICDEARDAWNATLAEVRAVAEYYYNEGI